ncbi:uncharacterized protein BCR38DRAFT_408269 [Pseudomassariella vexata]|uniref:Uncharacterized protein n=1 Tax=Pseudomassariella vexata TaxID=1141098 RepID=A0A1Y2E4F3_9PEZI|nr:uncharacterized protein BCR38DRAFT_408269 [Pseudomassariella vexata]ORY66317.1 hypothetical protein BCR38DRAFT_408269 [Pseudomassariella vexata]
MDDPAEWSVVRIVQELCTTEGSRRLRDGDFSLPDNFEERIRYYEIDGKQLVHEIKDHRRQDLFFQAMDIDKFTHKPYLLNAIEKLRCESQQMSADSQLATRKYSSAGEEAGGINATAEKRRKIQPQAVVIKEGMIEQGHQLDVYLGNSSLGSYDVLYPNNTDEAKRYTL